VAVFEPWRSSSGPVFQSARLPVGQVFPSALVAGPT
jgi:hypothetical protein